MPTIEEMYDEADRLKSAGQFDASATLLQEIIAIDATYALAHSALAVVLGKLNRHDEAIAHALKVAELEPNDPFSFTALSVIYQRGGRIPEAEEAKARASMMTGHYH